MFLCRLGFFKRVIMCGILCVQSVDPIPLEQHLSAMLLLNDRGPDHLTYQYQPNRFIAQTVLHFTGTADFYHETHDNFLAFNGEIYNWNQLNDSVESDSELVYSTVADKNWTEFKKFHGPWAWVYANHTDIYYATDPQGERHLFVYQDHRWRIICSEIAPILKYVQTDIQLVDYTSKHYPIIDRTPWAGIHRIEPGYLYKNNEKILAIDNVKQWVTRNYTGSYAQAVDELDHLMRQTAREIMPAEPTALSYSGGLDSSLIDIYYPELSKYTLVTTCDPVSQTTQRSQHCVIDAERWADYFVQLSQRLMLPILSWSFVGYYIIASIVKERAILSGTGADELFGGYPYVEQNIASPYSQGFNLTEDSFLSDYIIQSAGVDLLGTDLISGFHSKETRSPFVHQAIIKFALSMPREYLIRNQTKSLLRDLYRINTGRDYLYPKQGFAGYCNDSIKYINPQWGGGPDRLKDWREFILEYFKQTHGYYRNN